MSTLKLDSTKAKIDRQKSIENSMHPETAVVLIPCVIPSGQHKPIHGCESEFKAESDLVPNIDESGEAASR